MLTVLDYHVTLIKLSVKLRNFYNKFDGFYSAVARWTCCYRSYGPL